MDDFYSEMQDYLPTFEEEVKTVSSSSGDTNFLTNYFPNMFTEAIVPINPRHWPPYVAGAMKGADVLYVNEDPPTIGERAETVLSNVENAFIFLESSASDIQYRDRLRVVMEDTLTVNALSELGGDIGAYAAGEYATRASEKYFTEMGYLRRHSPLNQAEELNLRIFEQVARERDPSITKVDGIGLFRENAPDSMKEDLCNIPPRGARPQNIGLNDDYDNGLFNDKSDNGPKPGGFDGPNNSGSSSSFNSLNDSGSSTSFDSSNDNSIGGSVDSEVDDSTSCFGSAAGNFLNWLIPETSSDLCPPDPSSFSSQAAAQMDCGCMPMSMGCPTSNDQCF